MVGISETGGSVVGISVGCIDGVWVVGTNVGVSLVGFKDGCNVGLPVMGRSLGSTDAYSVGSIEGVAVPGSGVVET